MTPKTKEIIKLAITWAGLTSPVWLPILGGYLFVAFGEYISKPARKTVEGTNFAIMVTAFIVGNYSVVACCRKSVLANFIAIVLYSAVAVVVLFITGWSALLLTGYGH